VLGAASGDGGVPHGALLTGFAEAVLGEDDAWLATLRNDIVERLGAAALVDASAVVGFFNAIDRVADATGIPLDPERVAPTADLRAELGINIFAEGRA
jgi:hypothetical protein